MRKLHQAIMTVMLAAVVALAVGALQPRSLTAEAQHGQTGDPEAHFNTIAERLELTAAHRETLAEPFSEMFAAMQQLHRLHEVIAADLTDEQTDKLARMIHEALDRSSVSEGHGQRHHGGFHH